MADFLTCNSELKYASPAALPQFAIYIIALVESGKCLTRIGCISIYLPCADALAVSALVSDETGNICQRISEEYADLMRKPHFTAPISAGDSGFKMFQTVFYAALIRAASAAAAACMISVPVQESLDLRFTESILQRRLTIYIDQCRSIRSPQQMYSYASQAYRDSLCCLKQE